MGLQIDKCPRCGENHFRGQPHNCLVRCNYCGASYVRGEHHDCTRMRAARAAGSARSALTASWLHTQSGGRDAPKRRMRTESENLALIEEHLRRIRAVVSVVFWVYVVPPLVFGALWLWFRLLPDR